MKWNFSYFFLFFLLSHKESFFQEKKIHGFHVRVLKMVQKSSLEKMYGWMCVHACIRVLGIRKIRPSVSQELLSQSVLFQLISSSV